jgi:hypothetical protein
VGEQVTLRVICGNKKCYFVAVCTGEKQVID